MDGAQGMGQEYYADQQVRRIVVGWKKRGRVKEYEETVLERTWGQ